MNRRNFLGRGWIGLATLAALSGCTEETLEEAETKPPFFDVDEVELDLPVAQRADVVEAGVLEAERAEIEDLDDFEAYLEDRGVPVEHLAETVKLIEEKLEIEREDVDVIEAKPHGEGPVVELEYVRPADRDAGALHSVGVVAGGYASLVDSGHDAELLEATVLDEDRRPFGSFHVLTAWAEEYNEGITSARAYGDKPWMSAKSE